MASAETEQNSGIPKHLKPQKLITGACSRARCAGGEADFLQFPWKLCLAGRTLYYTPASRTYWLDHSEAPAARCFRPVLVDKKRAQLVCVGL